MVAFSVRKGLTQLSSWRTWGTKFGILSTEHQFGRLHGAWTGLAGAVAQWPYHKGVQANHTCCQGIRNWAHSAPLWKIPVFAARILFWPNFHAWIKLSQRMLVEPKLLIYVRKSVYKSSTSIFGGSELATAKAMFERLKRQSLTSSHLNPSCYQDFLKQATCCKTLIRSWFQKSGTPWDSTQDMLPYVTLMFDNLHPNDLNPDSFLYTESGPIAERILASANLRDSPFFKVVM